MSDQIYPVLRNAGVDGKIVTFAKDFSEPANRAALAFRAAVRGENWDGVLETASSLVSSYLRFDLAATTHQDMDQRLLALLSTQDWYQAGLPSKRKLWRIPAVFDEALTPQLREAAELSGQSIKAAVSSVCEAPLRVLNIGFAPGQPYLGSLPDQWNIPRQTELTKEVPIGAVTVAIRQIVMFAVPSPTGWRHIGQTAFRSFRPECENPFALKPGDEVLYQSVSGEKLEELRLLPDGGADWEELP